MQKINYLFILFSSFLVFSNVYSKEENSCKKLERGISIVDKKIIEAIESTDGLKEKIEKKEFLDTQYKINYGLKMLNEQYRESRRDLVSSEFLSNMKEEKIDSIHESILNNFSSGYYLHTINLALEAFKNDIFLKEIMPQIKRQKGRKHLKKKDIEETLIDSCGEKKYSLKKFCKLYSENNPHYDDSNGVKIIKETSRDYLNSYIQAIFHTLDEDPGQAGWSTKNKIEQNHLELSKKILNKHIADNSISEYRLKHLRTDQSDQTTLFSIVKSMDKSYQEIRELTNEENETTNIESLAEHKSSFLLSAQSYLERYHYKMPQMRRLKEEISNFEKSSDDSDNSDSSTSNRNKLLHELISDIEILMGSNKLDAEEKKFYENKLDKLKNYGANIEELDVDSQMDEMRKNIDSLEKDITKAISTDQFQKLKALRINLVHQAQKSKSCDIGKSLLPKMERHPCPESQPQQTETIDNLAAYTAATIPFLMANIDAANAVNELNAAHESCLELQRKIEKENEEQNNGEEQEDLSDHCKEIEEQLNLAKKVLPATQALRHTSRRKEEKNKIPYSDEYMPIIVDGEHINSRYVMSPTRAGFIGAIQGLNSTFVPGLFGVLRANTQANGIALAVEQIQGCYDNSINYLGVTYSPCNYFGAGGLGAQGNFYQQSGPNFGAATNPFPGGFNY